MPSKKIIKAIKELYESGIDAETIAEQYNMSVDDVEDTIADILEDESGQDKKGKTVEEKMESRAEAVSTGEAIKRTKTQALDIQKSKEEIGDFIWELFDNSGMPLEDIVAFVEYIVNWAIEHHDTYQEMENELDQAKEIIAQLYEVADEKAQKERLVKNYLIECASNGMSVDDDFVKSMLVD